MSGGVGPDRILVPKFLEEIIRNVSKNNGSAAGLVSDQVGAVTNCPMGKYQEAEVPSKISK